MSVHMTRVTVFCLYIIEILYVCHQWSRNCLPFRSTLVHSRFSVEFVLLGLYFYMYVLSIVVCPFVLFLLSIVLSVLRYTFSDCMPLQYLQTLPIVQCTTIGMTVVEHQTYLKKETNRFQTAHCIFLINRGLCQGIDLFLTNRHVFKWEICTFTFLSVI